MVRKPIDRLIAYCLEQADELAVLSPAGALTYSGEARAWLAQKDHMVDSIIEIEAASCSSDENDVAITGDCHSSKEEVEKENLAKIDSPNSTLVTGT